MPEQSICCPGGADSQTGVAVRKRYPQVTISSCATIPDVKDGLFASGKPHAVPIWNSHQGEISKADFVWNLIEEERIRLTDIWGQRIEFWLVKRSVPSATYGKIGSVVVAKTQCSNFLAETGAELAPEDLTTIAHNKFREGAEWDGALIAPGQGENETGFVVANKQTANPNNFTTFVTLSPAHMPLPKTTTPIWLSGVAMRSFKDFLGETEQSFFETMFSSANELNEVPKLIFVFKRTAKVGLLFEGTQLHSGDLLNAEEIESGDISVYEEAGIIDRHYTDELRDLFTKEFPELVQNDFILHSGVNACMFVCPALGIFTHGYEIDTVKPVFCFYISKLFELIDNGASCTDEQKQLFKRHQDAWQEKQSEFIEFKIIAA